MKVLLSLLTAFVLAQQFPAEPPKPGTPKDFRVPEARRFTLSNGLQVALVQWGEMPKVRVSLSVRSGNAFEGANEVWLADLTGSLLREGTATRNATQISKEAARMGGSLGVAVGGDSTSIGGEVLTEFGPEMVQLLADVVRNPRFPETELPRVKTNMSRDLAVSLSHEEQTLVVGGDVVVVVGRVVVVVLGDVVVVDGSSARTVIVVDAQVQEPPVVC